MWSLVRFIQQMEVNMENEVIEPMTEENPAIFLRKVDVIIQNENEEPIIIRANDNEKENIGTDSVNSD